MKIRNMISALLLTCLFLASGCATVESQQTRKSKVDLTRLKIKRFCDAIMSFRVDCNHYPDSRVGFKALVLNSGDPGWDGPYMDWLTTPLDCWGTRFKYLKSADGKHFQVLSAGPDEKFATRDDIRLGR